MELDTIYRGDCKDILNESFSHIDKYFADSGYGLPKEWADLIYMDPPFFSSKKYEMPWGDEKKFIGFDDRWGYGVDGLYGKYLPFMKERIQRCYNILKKTGSFYLHCDWHAGHYLKQICDNIFGYNNFRNEIIWCYSGGGIPKKDFPRKHDTIFRYTKSDEYTFNIEYRKYTEGTLNIGCHSPDSGSKPLREEGTPITDWWITIKPISGFIAKNERIGYPTQKPEALLERIIKVSSNPGDIVLDPFCGCGTTIVVAAKLNRHFIGIDVSEKACDVMTDRLHSLGVNPKYRSGIFTPEQLKKLSAYQFQDYIIDICLNGTSNLKKSSDKGIDGYTKDGIPIQVKQSKIGRNIIDEFEIALDRYYNQLGNSVSKKQGIIIGDGHPPDSVWREIDEAEKQRNIFIDYMNIQDCCNILNTRYKEIEDGSGWINKKLDEC